MSRPRLPVWALVPLAGLVWWAGGHLFWLLDGLRAVPVGPRMALPLSASLLSVLVLGALAGGVGAGLLCLLTPRRGLGVVATLGGVAAALVVTLADSAATLSGESPDAFSGDGLVVGGLCAVVVAVALVGWGLGSAAAFGRPGLALGLAVLAGTAPAWLSSVAVAVLGPSVSEHFDVVGRVSAWAGAAVLTLALVTAGARPSTRLVWWPPAVLAAWLVSPALTAAGYLEQLLRPGTGLPGTLPDSLAAAWQVFVLASSPTQRDLLPWVVALVVAAFVAFLRAGLHRADGVGHRHLAAPVGVSGSHSPVLNEQ